jgi:hypothetical protein
LIIYPDAVISIVATANNTNSKELNDFISFILCPESKLSYTLINYDDLPLDHENIDYHYLKNLDNNKLYEIVNI